MRSGRHWACIAEQRKRYWFYHADYTLESQFRYLAGLERVSEAKLREVIAGMTIPSQFAPAPREDGVATAIHLFGWRSSGFSITSR